MMEGQRLIEEVIRIALGDSILRRRSLCTAADVKLCIPSIGREKWVRRILAFAFLYRLSFRT